MFQSKPKEFGIIFGLLFLLLTVSFYDVVFLGKTFKITTSNSQALTTGVYGQEKNKPLFIPVNGTDAPVLEEPVYAFIKRSFAQGIFPLWNPHQACGYALIGMIQVGILYPLNLILYLLPETFSWDVFIFMRILLSGLFTYWLMRSLSLSVVASLGAGIMFMLSGPMLLLQYWTANIDILAPVLLIGLNRLVQNPRPQAMVFLALTVSLTIFGGHPEHIFLVNAYGAAFFIFQLVRLRKTINVKKVLFSYIMSYILGAGLAAIVLFPFFRNFLYEFWSGHKPGAGMEMQEQRDRALSLALPHFFQNVPLTYQWYFSGWWGGYIGTLPFALAFIALFNKHKDKLNYFFGAMAIIIIGKEYGVPIIDWLGLLPFFNMPRYAIHTPPLAALSVAILGGMGIQAILDNRENFKRGLIYCIVLLLIIGVHLIVLRDHENISLGLKAACFAIALLIIFQTILWAREKDWIETRYIGMILVAVVFLELFLYIHRERPRRFASFAKVPYIEILKNAPERSRSYGILWAFYPNTATGFGVDDLGYFEGLVPKRFVHFVNTLFLENHFRKDFRPPALRAVPITGKKYLLDLLNIRFIIAPETQRLSTMLTDYDSLKKNFNSIYDEEVNIFLRADAFPRTFVVHKIDFEQDDEKTLALLKKLGPELRYFAIINSAPLPSVLQALINVPPLDHSTAEITHYSPNKVVVDAKMENPGFLVLADAYHPDWKVFIDGREDKVYQTDYLLRSVFLPKGEHTVKFVFSPLSFYAGCWVSLISLLILLMLGFPIFVIPAKAGIHACHRGKRVMDSRLRGNDKND